MRRSLWPGVVAVSSFAIVMLTLSDLHSPFRIAFTLWFFAVCPGMAFVPLIRLRDPVVELCLGIGLSLAVETVVAGILVYAGTWSVDLGLILVTGITVVGAVLQLFLLRSGAALPENP